MSDVDPSTIEPLPIYVQEQVPQSAFAGLVTRISVSTGHPDARSILEGFIESQKAPTYDGPQIAEPPKPIEAYPSGDDPLTRVKQKIVVDLFHAIRREDSESIALLIQHNLVTANTTSEGGRTPLLEAVSTKVVHITKMLLELGADPNAFGIVRYDFTDQATRTPLMYAASIGSLPLVRLLFEPPYSANDTLVAPDGQIALRLASAAGHRAIVEYLPSRRAGGFLRWKTQNAHAIALIKEALRNIGTFIKFFIWHVPKFFVWVAPKCLVVLPIVRGLKQGWRNRKKFGGWCKHQVTETPRRVARFGKWVWRGVKKIPKGVWKFGKATLACIILVAIWICKLLIIRIPKATVVALKWIWDGIRSLGKAVGGVILKVVSLLHTILQAVITFLRNVTLKDVWNGVCDVLRAIFVSFPTTLWSWTRKFGDVSYDVMTVLFGWVGRLIWWMLVGLKWIVLYIPARLWDILRNLGDSISRGCSELMVWINPKA